MVFEADSFEVLVSLIALEGDFEPAPWSGDVFAGEIADELAEWGDNIGDFIFGDFGVDAVE